MESGALRTNSQSASPRSGNAVCWLLIVIILSAASYFRLVDLGVNGFWTDEFYHVIAAGSLLENGTTSFPNGNTYDRALPFTYSVAAFFHLLGESEFSARLPSALISLAMVLIGFTVVRKQVDTRSALLFATLLALTPYMLEWARMSRFYSAFQLFFFLACWVFYRGFEYDWKNIASSKVRSPLKFEAYYNVNLTYLSIALALFGVSLVFQELTVVFGFAFLVYCVAALVIIQRPLRRNLINNKYLVALGVIGATLLLAYLVKPNVIIDNAAKLNSKLPWAEYKNFPFSYYRWYLQDHYLALLGLSQLGFILLWFKDRKHAIYLNSMFLGMLLFMSLLAMKQMRYLYHVFPFMLLLSAIGISELSRRVVSFFNASSKERQRTYAGALAVALLLFSSYPWIKTTMRIQEQWFFTDWKAYFEEKGQLIDEDSTLIATNQNAIYYYFRAPDYYLNSSFDELPNSTESWIIDDIITNTDQLNEVIKNHDNVILLSTVSKLRDRYYVSNAVSKLISVATIEEPKLSNKKFKAHRIESNLATE